MNTESHTFLYIFSGGADAKQMSPEDMQKNMDAWFAWIGELKSKGYDAVAVTSTNDIFVLTQWAKDGGTDGKVLMLADGSADFVKKIGLDIDLTERGMGVRSRRYSMMVDNGVVKSLAVDTAADLIEEHAASTAALLIAQAAAIGIVLAPLSMLLARWMSGSGRRPLTQAFTPSSRPLPCGTRAPRSTRRSRGTG